MSQQYVPGDVYIRTISIFSNRGLVNVLELVKGMSIYESIITPGIVAELYMSDSNNVLGNLPILGGERVVLELSAPTREDRKFELVVAKVTDATPSTNLREKSYKLELVSPEVMTDKTVMVCKSYNTTISNIIRDITTNYLKTKKNVSIQQTRGVQKIILPSKRPFDTIKMLRYRSISVENKSSMYVFFENKDGFHYKTIEKLMSDGVVGDRVFYNNQTINTDITESQFRNIISYEQPQQFDLATRLQTGGLVNKISRFDLRTLSYKTTTSRFTPSSYKSADGALLDPDNSTTTSRYNTAGTSSWVIDDSGTPDTFIADGLGRRQNVAALIGQGSLNVHVYGDSSLTAGQLIDLNIAENIAETASPRLHPQLSGKYVIAFLRHIIASEGTMPRYTCSIEAIKGGYKSA